MRNLPSGYTDTLLFTLYDPSDATPGYPKVRARHPGGEGHSLEDFLVAEDGTTVQQHIDTRHPGFTILSYVAVVADAS